MTFSLLEERSKDSSPNVLVTFPDGYTDRLVLKKHYFNEKDRMADDRHCNYIGHLAKETDACVAMTGCLGSDNVEFTIMSTHALGSNGFVWSKEGDVHMVESNQEVIFCSKIFSKFLSYVPSSGFRSMMYWMKSIFQILMNLILRIQRMNLIYKILTSMNLRNLTRVQNCLRQGPSMMTCAIT